MGEAETTAAHSEARRMIDIFASVDATRYDLTTTTAAGDKEQFRRAVPLAELARTLPHLLDTAAADKRNVIVRPHGPGISFLQLDDLKGGQLARLAPPCFRHCRAKRTRNLPAACGKAATPTQPRAVRRGSPVA